jgi:hypothetical protein
MDLKTGSFVTFKKGLYADEDDAVYRVLEGEKPFFFVVFVYNLVVGKLYTLYFKCGK